MKLKKSDLILYAVTDRTWLDKGNHRETLYQQVEKALKGGVTMVQLREKDLSYEEFKEEALQIQRLCRTYQVPFLINDQVELAREIDADGVHVGQNDLEAGRVREILGPDKIIGVTAKTVQQAKDAQARGADYLGSGAVFGTSTKMDAKPMSIELLREITASVDIPVVAIGGIGENNLRNLAGTGIAGAAVVSGIFAAEDIEATSAKMKSILMEEILK